MRSLNRMPVLASATIDASGALQTQSGSRRRSSAICVPARTETCQQRMSGPFVPDIPMMEPLAGLFYLAIGAHQWPNLSPKLGLNHGQ